MRTARLPVLLVLLVAVTGCDATSEGRDLYAAGRFEGALAAFDRAVEAAGEEAPAPLYYDQALAAVRLGRFREAEDAALRALDAPGGEEIRPLVDFLLGNAAWLRSEAAELEANRPGGEPTAHEWAVASAVDALAAWRRAAESRDDWPEARRNVERALLRLDRLREQKAGGRRRIELPAPPSPEEAPPPAEPRPDTPADAPGTETGELTAAEVEGLFETLRQKEHEKLAGRRAEREARGGDVERDW